MGNLVISRALVVSAVQTYPANNPIILWDNKALFDNITADEEDDDFPATNLANPATNSYWQGLTAVTQYLTVLTNTVDPISALGVAKHNFGSAGIVVSVEGRTSAIASFVELVQEKLLADDSPYLARFAPISLYEIRLKMQAGSEVPRAAVLSVGPLLVMQRGIWTGHTPLPYGRVTESPPDTAESGDFLGRIITGEYRETRAQFDNIKSSFYREQVDPFLVYAKENPFFWAAHPLLFPNECGFAALINNPQPAPNPHHISFELVMRGVA